MSFFPHLMMPSQKLDIGEGRNIYSVKMSKCWQPRLFISSLHFAFTHLPVYGCLHFFFFRGLLMGPSYSHLWSIDRYWLSVLTCLKAGCMLSSFPGDQMNWEVQMPENVLVWFPLLPCLTSFFPLPAFPRSTFFIKPFHPNPSPSVCSWSSPSEMVLQQIWEATHRVSSFIYASHINRKERKKLGF